jgi:hypothetical protein
MGNKYFLVFFLIKKKRFQINKKTISCQSEIKKRRAEQTNKRKEEEEEITKNEIRRCC